MFFGLISIIFIVIHIFNGLFTHSRGYGKKSLKCEYFPSNCTNELPEGFVFLGDYKPEILQEMRYFTNHNFIGNPVLGYESGTCILTQKAAEHLCEAQMDLLFQNYTLKVYDCYRPQMSVDYFVKWAKNLSDTRMKGEFYPEVNKKNLFRDGYIAAKSGHSRGSTMDLSIVPLPVPKEEKYQTGDPLKKCFAKDRFKDNMIDMGTGFDCFSPLAWLNASVSELEYENRMMLKELMVKHGFVPYAYEWWHYTLDNEPFPKKYFDFPVKC